MKLCWWCKYFRYENETPGYSELTPGNSFGMCCAKDHWCFSALRTSEDDFRAMLTTAEECVDYKPSESVSVKP